MGDLWFTLFGFGFFLFGLFAWYRGIKALEQSNALLDRALAAIRSLEHPNAR